MIIDISKHNGTIDWGKARNGLDFCILRATCGDYVDIKFIDNAAGCTRYGIPFHVYHYLKATTAAMAREEAELFFNTVNGTNALFYVIDCEHDEITKKGNAKEVVNAFTEKLISFGIPLSRIGIYIGHHLYKTWNLDYDKYAYIWIPRYGANAGAPDKKPNYPCDIWQYTSVGKVDGINGNVDLNIINSNKPLSFFTNKIEGGNNMAVKIGSAKSSYGNTAPGDQSGGKEVSTENWYNHSKGWVVLRAKDPIVREKIAVAMERACANDNIGYSQGTRNTLYNDVKSAGFDPAKTTKKVNTDCSALVRVCVNYAGITVGDFTTDTEITKLMNTGAFIKYTDADHCKSSDKLLRGDILDTKTKGHTVVVLSNGAKAAKEKEYASAPASEPVSEPASSAASTVEVTGNTVNIRSGPGTQYNVVKVAKKGEKYEIFAEKDGFVPILVDGKVCYISKKYVR